MGLLSSYFIFLITSLFQELQQLGETIGTQSKGLPEDVIALLKSSTYKIRIFSRKEKYDEYVLKPIRSLKFFIFSVEYVVYTLYVVVMSSFAQLTHHFTPSSCFTD
jgi:hypothetical protein